MPKDREGSGAIHGTADINVVGAVVTTNHSRHFNGDQDASSDRPFCLLMGVPLDSAMLLTQNHMIALSSFVFCVLRVCL